MSNVVETALVAKDQTRQAVQTALTNYRSLRAEMKVTGEAFRQAGALASSLGSDALGSLIGGVAGSTLAVRQITAELGKSTAAMVALGAAGAATGASISEFISGLIEGKGLQQSREKLTLYQIQNDAVMEQLHGVNSLAAAEQEVNNKLRERKATIDNLKAFSDFEKSTALLEAQKSADSQIFNLRKKNLGELQRLIEAGNEKYLAGLQTIADFEQRVKNDAFEKNMVRLDAQIEAITRYNQAETEGAKGAAELAAEMQINILDGAASTRAQLDLDYQHRMEQIGQLQLTESEAIRLVLLASEEASKRKRQLALQEASQQLQATASLFGSLASLSAAFGKKTFKLTQALRIAEAIVNTASAVTNALASPAPWPVPLLFAAAAAAAGAAQIAVIAQTKPPQAHGGLDFVPQDQTFLLSRGERVVQPEQNVALGAFLDDWQNGGGAAGGRSVHVTVMLSQDVLLDTVAQASRDGRLMIDARAVA